MANSVIHKLLTLDTPTVTLIGSFLLFIGSLITLLLNRRESQARTKNQEVDTASKLQAIIDKVQERADRLYEEKVTCEQTSDKLRGDLAVALVTITDLKEQLAEKIGYINGLTDPLLKLEEKQKQVLAGRRMTDK